MSWISKHRVLLISVAIAAPVLWLGLVFASVYTPPVFAQFGNHYAGGTNFLNVLGMWRCDPVGAEDCTPTRENLIDAIANDPDIQNWLPIRISTVEL